MFGLTWRYILWLSALSLPIHHLSVKLLGLKIAAAARCPCGRRAAAPFLGLSDTLQVSQGNVIPEELALFFKPESPAGRTKENSVARQAGPGEVSSAQGPQRSAARPGHSGARGEPFPPPPGRQARTRTILGKTSLWPRPSRSVGSALSCRDQASHVAPWKKAQKGGDKDSRCHFLGIHSVLPTKRSLATPSTVKWPSHGQHSVCPHCPFGQRP